MKLIRRICAKVEELGLRISSFNFCIKYNNAKHCLEIKTYDGGNQGLHPSCLFFNDGWNGHKFWLVITPYKDMNVKIENPCIYYSDNGVDFTPVKTAFPLDDVSEIGEYNSDPELVYNHDYNRVECWWRRVKTNKYPIQEERNHEILYRSYTTDGVSWSKKEIMLDYCNKVDATRGIISPALIYEGGVYKLWVSCSEDAKGNQRSIDYYESVNNGQFELKSRQYLSNATLSHIDVIKDENDYKLIGFDVAKYGFPYKLYSFDNPISDYKYRGILLSNSKGSSWDNGRLYRPSVVRVNDKYYLYYSAYQKSPVQSNHVGLIIFNDWADLLKCFLIN